MNDTLINYLRKKAHQQALLKANTPEHFCKPGSDHFKDLEEKAFIRLIVEECANVAWSGDMEMSFEQRLRCSIHNEIKAEFRLE